MLKKILTFLYKYTVYTSLMTELGVQRQSKKGRDGGPSGDKSQRITKNVIFQLKNTQIQGYPENI